MCHDGFGKLGCRSPTADIGGEHTTFDVNRLHRKRDSVCLLNFAQILEHEYGREYHRGWVCRVLTGNLRRTPMDGLKDGAVSPEVGAWYQAQSSNQPRSQIADDIPVEILQQHDVKLPGIEHHLHAGVVHDQLFILDLGIKSRDFADAS